MVYVVPPRPDEEQEKRSKGEEQACGDEDGLREGRDCPGVDYPES